MGDLLLLGSQGRQPVSSQLLGSQAALQQSGYLPLQHLLPLQQQCSQRRGVQTVCINMQIRVQAQTSSALLYEQAP